MNRDVKAIGKAIFLIFWAAGVIAVYYVIHKPWESNQGMAPVWALVDVGLALAMVSLAGGLGRRLMGALPEAASLERMALHAAVGLGVLGTGVLLVGMLGWLFSWLAWLVLIAGIAWLRREVAAWLHEFSGLREEFQRLSGLEKWAAIFTGLLLVLNLFYSLAPPLKWDSLVYHLEIPKAYLSAGRIFFYRENLYAGFPQIVELLFTWAMALRSETTATTLGWAVGVVLFMGVEGFARRLVGESVRWLAPAVLLTGFSISQALNWAYIDLWSMLFGLAMLLALDYYCLTARRAWLAWAAMVVGFAISAKYTAGILLPVGAVLLLPVWDHNREKPPDDTSQALVETGHKISSFRRWLVDCFILGGVAFLVVAPWLLKNWVLTGNPLYPIITFEETIDPWQQTFQGNTSTNRAILDDLVLPLEVTLLGMEGAVVEGRPEYGASIGPLMLALLPGLLLGWGAFSSLQRRSLKRLLAAAVSVWAIWSVAAHFAVELMRPRHYYGVFAVVAVLAVAGFKAAAELKLPHIRIGRFLGALVALALGLAALNEVLHFAGSNPVAVVLGRQSRMDYISQSLGWYGPAMQAVSELPGRPTVLFLWEPRTFYCEAICIQDGKLDNWWYLRRARGESASIASALQEKGITYVLIHDAGIELVKQTPTMAGDVAEWVELDRFIQTELELVQSFGQGYSLYQLSSRAGHP